MIRNSQIKSVDLQAFYNKTYDTGYKNVFSKYSDGKDTSESNNFLLDIIDWKGKKVLDFGCGPGLTAKFLADAGANVDGIDFSKNAILEAKKLNDPRLNFLHGSIDDINDKYDVIVSLGTIEHMENPDYAIREFTNHLHSGGCLILTCPNWINTGGYIQIALYSLFNLKITLSDLFFFSPYDFDNFALKNNLLLERWLTFDHSLGNGREMIIDIEKRLKNISKNDSRLSNQSIEEFVLWLDQNKKYTQNTNENGAMAMYVLRK